MTKTCKNRMMTSLRLFKFALFLVSSSCTMQGTFTNAFILVANKAPASSTHLGADRSFFEEQQQQQENEGSATNALLTSSNLPGNFGFDPLHLAQTQQQLITYRKAEMKHARLAILAVMAILWSDLHIVDQVGAAPFLEGRAFPEFLGACVGFPAALELTYEEQHNGDGTPTTTRYHHEDDDPFHFSPASTIGEQRMQFAEIMTGRVCMIAAATRLTQYLLVGVGILGEDESLLSLLVPSAVQTTLESTIEEVIV